MKISRISFIFQIFSWGFNFADGPLQIFRRDLISRFFQNPQNLIPLKYRGILGTDCPSQSCFRRMLVSVWLCRSTTPLLQGEYEADVETFIPKLSHINEVFSNKFSTIVREDFSRCSEYTNPALHEDSYLVNSSITWRYHMFSPSWWRSIETVSLKSSAFDKPTTGCFLYFMQVSHFATTLSMMLFISLSIFPALVINFFRLFADVCTNCLCSGSVDCPKFFL